MSFKVTRAGGLSQKQRAQVVGPSIEWDAVTKGELPKNLQGPLLLEIQGQQREGLCAKELSRRVTIELEEMAQMQALLLKEPQTGPTQVVAEEGTKNRDSITTLQKAKHYVREFFQSLIKVGFCAKLLELSNGLPKDGFEPLEIAVLDSVVMRKGRAYFNDYVYELVYKCIVGDVVFMEFSGVHLLQEKADLFNYYCDLLKLNKKGERLWFACYLTDLIVKELSFVFEIEPRVRSAICAEKIKNEVWTKEELQRDGSLLVRAIQVEAEFYRNEIFSEVLSAMQKIGFPVSSRGESC